MTQLKQLSRTRNSVPAPGHAHFTALNRSACCPRFTFGFRSSLFIIVTYGSESQLVFIQHLSVPYPGGPPGQRHVFKMASLAVTWIPSSNL